MVQIFFFFIFLFYLTCFTTVPIFESIGPLVAEIWGGGQISPPPPMDSSPRNNPMGIGLRPYIIGLEPKWRPSGDSSLRNVTRRLVSRAVTRNSNMFDMFKRLFPVSSRSRRLLRDVSISCGDVSETNFVRNVSETCWTTLLDQL